MNKIKILWIDDDIKRNEHQKAFKRFYYRDIYDNNRYKVYDWKFINVTDKEKGTIKYVKNNIKLTQYDVIVIDHFFKNQSDIFERGITWAGFLRENKVTAPIVCVTAATNKNKISSEIFHEYDDLFLEENISDNFETIFSIAVGFKRIMGFNEIKTENIMNLLKVPIDDSEIIKQIMPVISSHKYINARNIYKWFKTDFVGLPGFLYDQQWTANLIGINEKSFAKVENLFRSAEYTGIFSTKNNRRWWRTIIKDIIFSKSSKQDEKAPWKAGHGLKAISDKDFSICFKCNEKYPETLGYDDRSTTGKFVPLHFRCSTVVEGVKKQLFFEEIRRMKTRTDK